VNQNGFWRVSEPYSNYCRRQFPFNLVQIGHTIGAQLKRADERKNTDDAGRSLPLVMQWTRQAQGVVDTMTPPVIVLDRNLSVTTANNAFIKTFRVERDDIFGQALFSLGGASGT
jgi:PAS domain-containing protein